MSAEIYIASIEVPFPESVTSDGERFDVPEGFEYVGDVGWVEVERLVYKDYVNMHDLPSGIEFPVGQFRLMLKYTPEKGVHRVDLFPIVEQDNFSQFVSFIAFRDAAVDTHHRQFWFGPGLTTEFVKVAQ